MAWKPRFIINVPYRHDFRAAASQIDPDLFVEVYNFWAEQATAVYTETGANQTFIMQSVPSNLAEQGRIKGGNPLGLPVQNMVCKSTPPRQIISIWVVEEPVSTRKQGGRHL